MQPQPLSALINKTKNWVEGNHVGLGLVVLIVGTMYFMLYQIKHPPCCDAVNYYELAKQYNTVPIETIKSPLRTYLYPWVLSHLISLSEIINLPFFFVMYAFQLCIYIAAVFFCKKSLSMFSKAVGTYVFLGLSFNFFIYPYFSLALTDSIYISLCIFFFGAVFKLQSFQAEPVIPVNRWVACAVTIVSVAIVLRPASIWLTFPLFVILIHLFINGKAKTDNVMVSMVLGSIPLVIQIYLNYVNYNVASFLPVQDLGSQQIVWGIENIKYATWLGSGLSQNLYPSVELIGSVDNPGKFWYLQDPYNGAKLLLVKLVGAFDFDYLVPYPYEKLSNWAPSIISFTFLYLGLFGIIANLFYRIPSMGSQILPVSFFLGWSAISLTSALELRFTIPMLTYLMIISIIFLANVANTRKFPLKIFLLGYSLFIPFCIGIALFVRSQSTF